MTFARCFVPALALLASACVGPQAPRPAVVPPGATGQFAALPVASIAPVPDDWWRLYADPQLDALVESSLSANADLRVAYAHLDAARASLRQARAARLPVATIESGLTIDNAANQPSAASVSTSDWDIAATASWDIDLFGRLRSAALAARADVEAQEAARDAVKVAVVADTVQAYLDLCASTQALGEARAVATAQDRAVALAREQLAAGDISPLEVSQMATLAASARAAVAPFEAGRMGALYRIATLQGQPPAQARDHALACAVVPRLRTAPVGDGAALLLRRPDIREAERKLAAATARIGIARAELYPRVNLGGALGLLTGGFDAVASPLVSWAFPNQGPVRAKIAQARASEQAALAGWDAAVLKALREVETGLADYDAQTRRNRLLADAVREARGYARRAAARVRLGDAAGMLQVDAERTLAGARLDKAQSDLAVAQAEVSLFRALGGGWRTGAPSR